MYVGVNHLANDSSSAAIASAQGISVTVSPGPSVTYQTPLQPLFVTGASKASAMASSMASVRFTVALKCTKLASHSLRCWLGKS